MIFTFYSYKGGVGRTMALANVAELFYQAGLRVLMVDWDLEAPGLERFFFQKPEKVFDHAGVIDLLLDYKTKMAEELDENSPLEFESLENYLIDVYQKSSEKDASEGKGSLRLLTAGKRSHSNFTNYAQTVLSFDWQDFYQNWEGELYFEWMREEFDKIADIILIDSRTGVTEMGGVCTYQLADVVVMFCATNQQNLDGIHEMAQNFTSPEAQKLRGGRPLDILIIPARIERAESPSLDGFKKDFLNLFKDFALKEKGIDVRELWELRIPYIPKYAFKEIIAVRESGLASAEDMGDAVSRLASTISRLAPQDSPISSVSSKIKLKVKVRDKIIEEPQKEDRDRPSEGKIKNLFWALASQLPVVGIAFAWWTAVLNDPIVAAVLLVIYELIVLFWKVLGKPVWQEVWEKELKALTVKALADWLKVSVLNLFSNFRRRYNQHIIYEHHVFSVRGLLTPGQGALELERVFVELQIAPSHLLQINTNPIAMKSLSGSQSVWEFLRRLRKTEATALAILGPPGCGKTTLLKHLALTFAANRQRHYRLKSYTPILLFLREHAKTIIQESLSLADLAQHHFSDQTRYPELEPPPFWFSRQLKAGNCLILLDGLDEVVDVTQRQTIAAWIDQQTIEYPECLFILTSRPQGYRNAPLSRAYILEMMPFHAEQVKKFIQNWYLATKLNLYGKDDIGVRQDADREAQNLLQRLQEQPRLVELTVNPLLLTMLTNVHNYRGALPSRRIALYSEICDVLLGHWNRGKGVGDHLTTTQKRIVLQPLAEEMMTQKIREISVQDALTVMTPHLIQLGVTEKNSERFLDEIQANSGLLLEREMGMWSFAHLIFQEYFCATHWKETGKTSTWDTSQWQVLISDTWWHETLRLYAATTIDATPLVNACLKLNTSSALNLAQNIAKEAMKLDHSIQAALSKSLIQTAIHLRSQPQIVSENEFITVFRLDRTLRPLGYIQNEIEDHGKVVLDCSTGLMWQKSGTNNPVTYKDAQEYIKQLNRQNFSAYDDWRLPTIDELMSLLEPGKQFPNELHINPIFDGLQQGCWSADKRSSNSAWLIEFMVGIVNWGFLDNHYHVRGVRS